MRLFFLVFPLDHSKFLRKRPAFLENTHIHIAPAKFNFPELFHGHERMMVKGITSFGKIFAKMSAPGFRSMECALSDRHGSSQKVVQFPMLNQFLVHAQALAGQRRLIGTFFQFF